MRISVQSTTRNKLSEDQNEIWITPIYEKKLVESYHHDWEKEIVDKYFDGSYNPATPRQLSIPKPKGLVRPGTILSLEDNYAYNLLMELIFDPLKEVLTKTQGKQDLAYQILNTNDNALLFKHTYKCWNHYKICLLKKLTWENLSL